jgi:outer membrane protein TolC
MSSFFAKTNQMRSTFLLTALLLSGAAGLAAQDYDPFFPKPSYFKRHFGTVSPKVELQNPVHLDDVAVSGKLELSLKNYLQLAMANNPDITIQVISVEIQKDAITRAFSIFDPFATASFSTTRQLTPSSSALNGASSLNTLTQPLSLSYTQLLATGATSNISFGNTRLSTNSAFATYNPSDASSLNISVTQPLLRGRGAYFTRLPITIARSKLKSSQYSLEDQVIQLISTAEVTYWNAISAKENLRVQEEALALADTALKRSKRELELGAISSLEIYQPEANYATAQLAVVQARYNLQNAESALRRQMGADANPKYRDMPLVLTESVSPPADTMAFDREALVERALRRRPDLRSQNETVAGDDLAIIRANNGLLPSLSLTAQYGAYGQGGNFYSLQNVFLANGAQSTVTSVTPGGFGDAFTQLFGFGYPTYGFGLTLQLPIRDRNAAANLADALVNKKLDALRGRSIERTIRLQVLQAITQVENSKASVELAKVARDLAQKRVDADQKRYELGTTTIFFVLASQNDLVTAESALVRESINYRINLMTLLQRTGELLDERGIQIQ